MIQAVVFLQNDSGEPGFGKRFADTVTGDEQLVAEAMSRTIRAVERAGRLGVRVTEAAEVRATTSTGALCLAAMGVTPLDRALKIHVQVADHAGGVPDLGVCLRFPPNTETYIGLTDQRGILLMTALGRVTEVSFGAPLPEVT